MILKHIYIYIYDYDYTYIIVQYSIVSYRIVSYSIQQYSNTVSYSILHYTILQYGIAVVLCPHQRATFRCPPDGVRTDAFFFTEVPHIPYMFAMVANIRPDKDTQLYHEGAPK